MREPVVTDAVQVAGAGVRVQYETPGGAEYVAVCVPAFGPHLVHREP